MKIGEAMAKTTKVYVLPKAKKASGYKAEEEDLTEEVETEGEEDPKACVDMALQALSEGDNEAAIDHLYDAIDAISAGMETEDVGELD